MLVMITVENTRLLLRFKHTHRRRKLFPNWEARSHPHSSWWLLKEFPLHRSIKTQQNSSSIHLKTDVCSRKVWMEHFKPKFCQNHLSDLSQLNLTQAFTLKPNKQTSGEGLLQTWRRKGLQHALIEIEWNRKESSDKYLPWSSSWRMYFVCVWKKDSPDFVSLQSHHLYSDNVTKCLKWCNFLPWLFLFFFFSPLWDSARQNTAI